MELYHTKKIQIKANMKHHKRGLKYSGFIVGFLDKTRGVICTVKTVFIEIYLVEN